MKLKVFHYYIIGFVIAVTIGFILNEYIGFLCACILYAIVVGIFSPLHSINPVEKSPYDKRKSDPS